MAPDRRRRVRDRIMHVENIESFRFSGLRHFYRQRQSVIGAREEGVMRKLYKMKVQPVLRDIQPDRSRIAEKMNFMSAPREFRSQSRGQNSAPTNQRKTGDTDAERILDHAPPI